MHAMCNLSWTPHSNLEKGKSLNVSPKMGCLKYMYITRNATWPSQVEVLGDGFMSKRKKERPKQRWTNVIKQDLTERGLSGDDRSAWRQLVRQSCFSSQLQVSAATKSHIWVGFLLVPQHSVGY